MSGGAGSTRSLPDGHVYVRREVLYVDRRRVHLADEHEYELAPQDAALLELVHRGDSDFARLCRRIGELSGDGDPERIARELGPVLCDPRSILELRPSIRIERPEVIVCDFSAAARLGPGRGIVERLRPARRVLHLGLERHVRGEWPWNASLEASRRAGVHETWNEFAQWCRGVVASQPGALLVLCGQQDAVLFGDLAAHLRTVVLLDPDWPARVGPADILGDGWIPEDPYEVVPDLFYALRFSALDDLASLGRVNGSSFARLEGHALKHAAAVGYVKTDQPAALAAIGRTGPDLALVNPHATRRLRALRPGGPRTLLLIADLERGLEPLLPFLHVPHAALDSGRVQRLVLATPGPWVELCFRGGSVEARDVGRHRPRPSECVAAVVLPGLVRDCRAAMEVLASGVPVGLVPSMHPHPIDSLVSDQAVLRGITGAGLVDWIDRLLASEDPLARELVHAQRRALRPLDVADFVAAYLPGAERAAPHLLR